MDFNPKVIRQMPRTTPLPFYLAYGEYLKADEDRELWQDMEYFGQNDPQTVKKYKKKIADYIDHIDYEGSMIYDEYPDSLQIGRLTDIIFESECKEELHKENLKELIGVLLCQELCKRRQKKKSRFFYFS